MGSVFTGFELFNRARALESKQTWVRIHTPALAAGAPPSKGPDPPEPRFSQCRHLPLPFGSVRRPWASGEWLGLGVRRLIQRMAVVVQDATERMSDERAALDPSACGALVPVRRLGGTAASACPSQARRLSHKPRPVEGAPVAVPVPARPPPNWPAPPPRPPTSRSQVGQVLMPAMATRLGSRLHVLAGPDRAFYRPIILCG